MTDQDGLLIPLVIAAMWSWLLVYATVEAASLLGRPIDVGPLRATVAHGPIANSPDGRKFLLLVVALAVVLGVIFPSVVVQIASGHSPVQRLVFALPWPILMAWVAIVKRKLSKRSAEPRRSGDE
ncbi:MAG: hypothetical protein U0838_13230 [Chloroflexota bacterium]